MLYIQGNEMINSLILLYNNSNHRGPGKVVQNLKLGLDKNNIKCKNFITQSNILYEKIGMLQVVNNWNILPASSLVGPNLFVIPSENKAICKHFNNFLVPSQWVLDIYRNFSELDHAKIDIWTVGIDTDKWQIINRQTEKLKCLLYYKNRSKQDLIVVKKILQKYNIEFKELHYGNYVESDLIDACAWANFCVLLTGTESQGIAYMEILSTNLPCFVFNKPTWDYDGKHQISPATSVPYFNKNCGEITDNIDLIKFEDFLDGIKKYKYNPGDFIREYFNLKKCSQDYVNLLK
jgi:hypothetical protein